MSSYTTEEIRRAFLDAQGRYVVRDMDTLMSELAKWAKADHEAKADHKFADTDTITVKEFRDAYASVVFDDNAMLAWIREHREPDYPYGTVWKDTGGVIWFRGSDKMWYRFGNAAKFPDDSPKRPLKQMKEQ